MMMENKISGEIIKPMASKRTNDLTGRYHTSEIQKVKKEIVRQDR